MTKLTFLGTGTSLGVPLVSCHCSVCSSEDERDKRLRSSAIVEYGGKVLVIDAGPDFRTQMLRQKVNAIDAILVTHEHKDHIGGLDEVRAFNYTLSRAIDIYGLERTHRVIKKDFDYAFGENRYPGVPDFSLHTIDDKPFYIGEAEIVPIHGKHYKLDVIGYRFGALAYLTDFNHIDREQIDLLRGVEVLVINALQHESHISHFTLEEALEVIAEVSPQRAYLTHISHTMGLHEEVSQELPEGVFLAYDGLVIKTKE